MLLYQGAASETLPNARESPITFHRKTITALPMSLGVQMDGRWKTSGGGSFTPLLQLAWIHDFQTERSITRSFGELPSLLISRTTVPTDADAASVRFGGQSVVEHNPAWLNGCRRLAMNGEVSVLRQKRGWSSRPSDG